MNKLKIGLAIIIGAISQSMAGNGWWTISTSDFYRLEPMSNPSLLTLNLAWYRPAITVNGPDGLGNCVVSQVNLTPPLGKENQWMSLLLSGIATGKRLSIYGNCADASIDVDGKNSNGRVALDQ